ncbi:HisA/HisF-related TIM barrel protein, partial [Acinetobacter baumannii]|nr:HisA/HisF-related TIM barrel protein [Acinetobacter baumannii]
ARDFAAAGAERIHLVDLEGGGGGGPENLAAISKILAATSAKAQVGGGIRNLNTVARYLDSGISRVILGTAAVTDPGFLEAAL